MPWKECPVQTTKPFVRTKQMSSKGCTLFLGPYQFHPVRLSQTEGNICIRQVF